MTRPTIRHETDRPGLALAFDRALQRFNAATLEMARLHEQAAPRGMATIAHASKTRRFHDRYPLERR